MGTRMVIPTLLAPPHVRPVWVPSTCDETKDITTPAPAFVLCCAATLLTVTVAAAAVVVVVFASAVAAAVVVTVGAGWHWLPHDNTLHVNAWKGDHTLSQQAVGPAYLARARQFRTGVSRLRSIRCARCVGKWGQ